MARRGRPSSFDRDEALGAAMNVFWAKGYEGATLEELLDAMGAITAPSLYHAFGSKELLFKEAVDLYVSRVGAPAVAAMEEAASAREGIAALLKTTAMALSRPGQPHGCMLVSSAAKCARANNGAEHYVRSLRLRAPDAIKARLKRAIDEGDLDDGVDIAAIASFYTIFLHGMGVRATDGARRAELVAASEGAMAAWDGLTAKPSSRSRPK